VALPAHPEKRSPRRSTCSARDRRPTLRSVPDVARRCWLPVAPARSREREKARYRLESAPSTLPDRSRRRSKSNRSRPPGKPRAGRRRLGSRTCAPLGYHRAWFPLPPSLWTQFLQAGRATSTLPEGS